MLYINFFRYIVSHKKFYGYVTYSNKKVRNHQPFKSFQNIYFFFIQLPFLKCFYPAKSREKKEQWHMKAVYNLKDFSEDGNIWRRIRYCMAKYHENNPQTLCRINPIVM